MIIQCFGSVFQHKINKQYIDEHSVCTEVKGVRHTFKTNAAAEKFSTNNLCPGSGLPQLPLTFCENNLHCKYQHFPLLNSGSKHRFKTKKDKTYQGHLIHDHFKSQRTL